MVAELGTWTNDTHAFSNTTWSLVQAPSSSGRGYVRYFSATVFDNAVNALLRPLNLDVPNSASSYIFSSNDCYMFSTVDMRMYDLGLSLEHTLPLAVNLFDAATISVDGLRGPNAPAFAGAFSSDDQVFAGIAFDYTVSLWFDPALGTQTSTIAPPGTWAYDMSHPMVSVSIAALGPRSFRSVALAEDSNDVAFFWDFAAAGSLREGQIDLSSVLRGEAPRQLALNPADPSCLAVATSTSAAVVCLTSENVVATSSPLPAPTDNIKFLAFSADGKYLNVWVTTQPTSVAPYNIAEHRVFSSDGSRLLLRVAAEALGTNPITPAGILRAKVDSNRLGLWQL